MVDPPHRWFFHLARGAARIDRRAQRSCARARRTCSPCRSGPARASSRCDGGPRQDRRRCRAGSTTPPAGSRQVPSAVFTMIAKSGEGDEWIQRGCSPDPRSMLLRLARHAHRIGSRCRAHRSWWFFHLDDRGDRWNSRNSRRWAKAADPRDFPGRQGDPAIPRDSRNLAFALRKLFSCGAHLRRAARG